MNGSTHRSKGGPLRLAAATLAGFALLVSVAGGAQAVAVTVPLGAAESFAVLAATGVTNSGASTIWGDIGSFPTTSIDGGITVLGTNHGGDLVTQAAKVSLDAAVIQANGQGPIDGTIVAASDLGGQTLTPGLYVQGGTGTMLLNGGTLTLDAGGNPNAVWIFRGTADLSVNVGSTVSLIGGAQACNVYWVMGAGAAIGGSSTFVGTVMAYTSVTFGTNATLDGRALAQTGNVTLLDNTITRSPCTLAPAGGVGTGDGSTSQTAGNTAMFILIGAVLVAGMGATGVLVTRRRRDDGT